MGGHTVRDGLLTAAVWPVARAAFGTPRLVRQDHHLLQPAAVGAVVDRLFRGVAEPRRVLPGTSYPSAF